MDTRTSLLAIVVATASIACSSRSAVRSTPSTVSTTAAFQRISLQGDSLYAMTATDVRLIPIGGGGTTPFWSS